MKRKFLLLVCLVMIVALVSTSCDLLNFIPGFSDQNDQTDNNDQDNNDDQNENCEHTYSAKWSTNSTEHWHAATCEHAELKSDVAAHADADENGECDVCSYEVGHTHTYEDTWTSDDTNHWKKATCSHTTEKGELAVHVDADTDGVCDVCTSHVHVVDIYGKCTVCGDQVSNPDVTKLEVILPVILSSKNNVTGGSITIENANYGISNTTTLTQNILYTLGNAAAYYKVVYDACSEDIDNGVITKNKETQWAWYELLADNSVSGVYRTESEEYGLSDFMINSNPMPDLIGGYYFSLSTLVDAYGPENLLNSLYNLSQSDAASDYTYIYNEGTYSFGFAYLYVNPMTGDGEGDHTDYYTVSVSFKVSDKGTLGGLRIQCNCYGNSLENENENDYTYDQNTGEITLKDNAVADTYIITLMQTEGERTYEAEHKASDFAPVDFDAFLDEECTTLLGDTVTITIDDFVNLYFGNCTPEGSDVAYIIDTLVVNADESIWVGKYGNNVSFLPYSTGTYPIELTLGGKTFSFTIVVEEKEIVDPGEQPENTVAVFITDNNGWIDLVTFVAPASGEYTFIIPAGLGAFGLEEYNDFGDAFVDPDDPYRDDKNGGSFTVALAEGETYEFYVKSPEKNITVYISYTFEASDVGGGDIGGGSDVATAVVGGSYSGTGIAGTCTLVIDTDAGTVTMDGNVYTYEFADGKITVYINGNEMSDTILGVTLGSDGVPTAFVCNGNRYTVTEGGDDDDTVTSIVDGTYISADGEENPILTVVIYGNAVSFNYNPPMGAPSSLIATYAIVDGVVVLYDLDGIVVNPLNGRIEIDENGVPVSADYNGYNYVLVKGGSSEGGDVTEPDPDGSEDYPYTIDSLPADIKFYSDTNVKVYYLYTAPANGFITITLSVENDSWIDIYPYLDGYVDGLSSQDSNYETTATFFVKAGTTYRIGLGTYYIAGETTFSLAFTEGECSEHVYQPVFGWHPNAVDATCVAPGVAVYECTVCGEITTEATEIDPDAHSFWGEEEIITPANCATQTNGVKKVHCANKGCTETIEVEIYYSSVHDWDVQKDTYATCTENGEYYAVCTVCGMVESYDREASGHYNYTITCGESGECMECGEIFTKDHYIYRENCNSVGSCYACGETFDPIEHNYVDGICTNCGKAEGAEDEEIVISGSLEIDVVSTIAVSDDDLAAGYVYYSFTPWENGNYLFNSDDLYVPYLLDADGNYIYTDDYGYFVLESYFRYTVVIELNTYLSAGEYDITPTYIYPEGHQNNPLWFFGNETTVAYPGDYTTVWHQFYATSTGTLTVTADNEQATVLISAVIGYELDGEGSVSMGVVEGRLYYIGVISFGISEAIDIKLTLSYVEGEVIADGTVNTPYTVEMGENSVELDSWSSVFFLYAAEAPGTLTLSCENENYVWYATTDMSQYSEATTGEKVINVEYGECVYVYIENTSMETATISFSASFEIDPEW